MVYYFEKCSSLDLTSWWLHHILFPRCFVDVFLQLKHEWAITWGMRCSVMFLGVKTSSTEEGLIVFTRALLCTSVWHVPALTRELELIAAAGVNTCVGFIPASFWTVPQAALQGLYAEPSLVFTENVPKKIKYPVSGSCVDENALLMSEENGQTG